MPNHGRLKKHLFGSALSICDKLVIDEEWNLCVGNVTAGNICGTLIASDIIEKNSAAGIRYFGNIFIQDGFFLTGNVDLTGVVFEDLVVTGNITYEANLVTNGDLCVNGTAAMNCVTGKLDDGPTIKGNTELQGSLEIVGGPLTVPQIFSSGVCTDVLLVSTLTPKVGNDIDVVQGNFNVVDGCFTVSKSTSGLPSEGEVTTTTPAGIARYEVLTDWSTGNGVRSFTLNNPCIQSDSIVLATIGAYMGAGCPMVSSIVVSAGQAVINLYSAWCDGFPLILTGTIIPVQYLIV